MSNEVIDAFDTSLSGTPSFSSRSSVSRLLETLPSVADAQNFRSLTNFIFGFLYKARDSGSYQDFLKKCEEGGIKIKDSPGAKLIFYTVKRSKQVDDLNISSVLSGTFADIYPSRFAVSKGDDDKFLERLILIPLIYATAFVLYGVLQSVFQVFKIVLPKVFSSNAFFVRDDKYWKYEVYREDFVGLDFIESLVSDFYKVLDSVLGVGWNISPPPQTTVYTMFDVMLGWIDELFDSLLTDLEKKNKDYLSFSNIITGSAFERQKSDLYSNVFGYTLQTSNPEIMKYFRVIVSKFMYKIKQFFRVKVVWDAGRPGDFFGAVASFFETLFNEFMVKFLEDSVKELIYNFRPSVDVYAGDVVFGADNRPNNPTSFERSTPIRPPQESIRHYPNEQVVFKHKGWKDAQEMKNYQYIKEGDYFVKYDKPYVSPYVASSITASTPPLQEKPLYNLLITSFYEENKIIYLNGYYWSFMKEKSSYKQNEKPYYFVSQPVEFISRSSEAKSDLDEPSYFLNLVPPSFEVVDKAKLPKTTVSKTNNTIRSYEEYESIFEAKNSVLRVFVPEYNLIDFVPIYKGKVFEVYGRGDGVLPVLRIPVYVDSVFEESGFGGVSEIFSFSQKLEPTQFSKTDKFLYYLTSIELDDKTFSNLRLKILLSHQNYTSKALKFLHFFFKYLQTSTAVGDMNIVFVIDFGASFDIYELHKHPSSYTILSNLYALVDAKSNGKVQDFVKYRFVPFNLYFSGYVSQANDQTLPLLAPNFYVLKSLNISYPTEEIFNYSYLPSGEKTEEHVVFEVEMELERVQLQRIVF